MKKVLFIIFLISIYPFFSFCEDFPDMTVYSYTPVTRAINTIFEINFYNDGLIKEIKKYLNPQERGISSEELNKLDDIELLSTSSVIRKDKEILVYNTKADNNREMIQEFSLLELNSVKIWESEYADDNQKILISNYDNIIYEYIDEILFSYTIYKDYIDYFHFPTKSKNIISFNKKGTLKSIEQIGTRNWLVMASNDNDVCTVIRGEEDDYPFLRKFRIQSDHTTVFVSGVMNTAIIDIIDNGDSVTYIALQLLVSTVENNKSNLPIFTSAMYNSSSYLTESKTVYLPENLGVSVFSCPWVEGVSGPGIGETITIERDASFGEIFFSNGYFSYDNPTLYEKNGRVKRIKIEGINSGFSTEISIEDKPEPQIIELPKIDTKIIITILDVFPGTAWDDTCINYILVR